MSDLLASRHPRPIPDRSRSAGSAEPRATRGQAAPQADLRHATVLLVHPRDSRGDAVLRELRRIGCRVEAAWPAPTLPPIGFDFALVAIDAELLAAVPWLSGTPPVPVVALMDGEKGIPTEVLRLSNAQAVLVTPCQPAAVLANLALARNIFGYERRLTNKMVKLEETLHASRQIEQAKLILMKQRNLGANEAYDYLRRQAMTKQMSVAAISAALVDAFGLIE